MNHVKIWSPGRVNLIGEHTDYNGGWVLPLAIERGTTIYAQQRTDHLLCATSKRINNQTDSIPLKDLESLRGNSWIAYVRGSVWALQQHGIDVGGADLTIDGDLPLGGGLSSSASLEVGVICAMLALTNISLEPTEIALLAQKAEREYVGVQCGIMDQLAVAHGQADHALLIDCRDLAIEAVPLPAQAHILIVDSGVARTLAGSAYNQRRAECEAAVAALQQRDPTVQTLRDCSLEQLEAAEKQGLLSGVLLQRARHVISENARTQAAAAALQSGDLATVGQLMNESHRSLQTDYAVSSSALDTLSSLLRTMDGVWGARLTGAGFGGCCVALVDAAAIDQVSRAIGPAYFKASGNQATCIPTRAAAGAHRIEEA